MFRSFFHDLNKTVDFFSLHCIFVPFRLRFFSIKRATSLREFRFVFVQRKGKLMANKDFVLVTKQHFLLSVNRLSALKVTAVQRPVAAHFRGLTGKNMISAVILTIEVVYCKLPIVFVLCLTFQFFFESSASCFWLIAQFYLHADCTIHYVKVVLIFRSNKIKFTFSS